MSLAMIRFLGVIVLGLDRVAELAERAGGAVALRQRKALDKRFMRDNPDRPLLTQEDVEQALIEEWAVRMRDGWVISSWPGWDGSNQ